MYNIIVKSNVESPSELKSLKSFKKSWDFVPTRGGAEGSDRIPAFWPTLPKQKFALQLAINVMKHTLHKWGGKYGQNMQSTITNTKILNTTQYQIFNNHLKLNTLCNVKGFSK